MKTAFLTGATSGMGHQIARDLAVRGWRLLLPVRDLQRGDRLAVELHHLGCPDAALMHCDLSDHQQVSSLCEHVVELGGLDLVINNAGIGGGVDHCTREENAVGTELRMAVNALTPHLIARELAPGLRAGGRIVQVGSAAQAELPLDDLNFHSSYDGFEAYMRSKLALMISTIELAARGVPVNVVHPATQMPTSMVHEDGMPARATIDDGALAVLRVALDSDLADISGEYFERFDRATPHRQAADPQARRAVVRWLDDRASRRSK